MEGIGGARRDRTADLLHAMQALSQLSYGPISGGWLVGAGNEIRTRDPNLGKVVLYQLSYSRVLRQNLKSANHSDKSGVP